MFTFHRRFTVNKQACVIIQSFGEHISGAIQFMDVKVIYIIGVHSM